MNKPTTPQQAENIILEAQDAFWAVVAKHHPECKSDHLMPNASGIFDDACRAVIKIWLISNTESPVPPPGTLLEVRPAADPVLGTRWGFWANDADPGNPRWYEWDDPRSIAIVYTLLIQWSESLGIPDIHPHILQRFSGRGEALINDFEHWYRLCGQHSDGYANAFNAVIDEILQSGWSVYVSDTKLEIYRTEDLS